MLRDPGGRSREVAEYRFDESIRAIAKVYREPDQALDAYRILDSLWNGGFGKGSHFRVPEPLGYLGDHGVIVMEVAPGDRLLGLRRGPREEFRQGLTGAATWLARLHSSSHRLGPRDDVEQGFTKLASSAAAAAAVRPDLFDLFRGATEELQRRYPADQPGEAVQTHGRYHPRHVFLSAEGVTVIDLDRVAVSDPAKDLGEFIHRLRVAARTRAGTEAADRWTQAFLNEYRGSASAPLPGLSYYWSYSILSTLVATIPKAGSRPGRKLKFLRAEFDAVPRRAAAWSR